MDFVWCVPRGITASWVLNKAVLKGDCRVRLYNRALGGGRDAFFRTDLPHPNTPYNFHHLNINGRFSGVRDPHTMICCCTFFVSIYWFLFIMILFLEYINLNFSFSGFLYSYWNIWLYSWQLDLSDMTSTIITIEIGSQSEQ